VARQRVRTHRDLDVYRRAFAVAMRVFEASKQFPKEETYSLTDRIRHSSRSVCANPSEACRKRRYKAAFISKLSDAETEAAETQTWIEFAVHSKYWSRTDARDLYREHDRVIGTIVSMINSSDDWLLPPQ
jgi:four helix bundle protein